MRDDIESQQGSARGPRQAAAGPSSHSSVNGNGTHSVSRQGSKPKPRLPWLSSPRSEILKGESSPQRSRSLRSPVFVASPSATPTSPRAERRFGSRAETMASAETPAEDDGPPRRHLKPAATISPSEAPSYTIFNKSDKPNMEPMQSYLIGGGRAERGREHEKRGRFSLPSLPRIPSMPSAPGATILRQQQRSHSRSDQGKDPLARRSSSKRKKSTQQRQGTDQSVSSPHPGSLSLPDGEAVCPDNFPHATVSQDVVPTSAPPMGHLRASNDDEDSVSQAEDEIADVYNDSEMRPAPRRLSDLHAKHPYLKTLPLAVFPGQGAGKSSEFAQEAPLWARQPYKLVYFAYFGLSIGLVFLPWFALVSLIPSKRPRESWTWKRSTLIKLYRHGTRLTFRTHTSLSRDLTKEVPHSKTVRGKFVWVDALSDDLIRGELRRMMLLQGLTSRRTCGFWYGERDGGGGVGQRATPREKVIYHLHGGAYWIGTAHENDVTAAVNMQALKALDKIYSSRLPEQRSSSDNPLVPDIISEVLESQTREQQAEPMPHSPHPEYGRPTAGGQGLCKRAFSLDYRLCVPGRPEIGSFPAPLLDALAGYRYLVRECNFDPENIIVAGDSAGGNLGLALCRYLRDEKIDGMPGALLLLSPWADTSRSHSGPAGYPNKFSSVYTNRKSDIISPSLAFRNTAVSALLGKMEARETYRNPYLSSCSLQLSPSHGGSGPSWGYEGFPKRVYICTGTAEISHDQHLTLAYRMAGGSRMRVPLHAESVDASCAGLDPYETAARLNYPRPRDYEIVLWPSAQNTPAGTPLPLPEDGWTELREESVGKEKRATDNGAKSLRSNEAGRPAAEAGNESVAHHVVAATGGALSAAGGALNAVGGGLKKANEHIPHLGSKKYDDGGSTLSKEGMQKLEEAHTAELQRMDRSNRSEEERGALPGRGAEVSKHVAGTGENTTAVKEKDTEETGATNTHVEAEGGVNGRNQSANEEEHESSLTAPPSNGNIETNQNQSMQTPANNRRLLGPAGSRTPAIYTGPPSNSASNSNARLAGRSRAASRAASEKGDLRQDANGKGKMNGGGGGEYFDFGGEDRVVVLDVCKDGIHDYTLFDWFEPERGQTWSRIAKWIDEEI